jgi:hypothetical protein
MKRKLKLTNNRNNLATDQVKPAQKNISLSTCHSPLLRGDRGVVENPENSYNQPTNRLCGLNCPSCTNERGGKGDCVKEGGGEEGERERERALGLLLFVVVVLNS